VGNIFKGRAKSPEINYPWCMKCQDYVDEVSSWQTIDALHVITTVYCHGRQQTQRLSLYEIETAKEIRYGDAFGETKERLGP